MTAINAPIPVLPASDLGRARKFYEDVLGFRPTDEEVPMGVLYEAHGGYLSVYETATAGTARNTQVGWRVDDLDAEVRRLQDAGVSFETFEMPGLEWDGVIATMGDVRSAWFHDTEGNTICIEPTR